MICVSLVAVPPNSVPFGVNSEAVSTLICVIAGLAFCKNGGKPSTVIFGKRSRQHRPGNPRRAQQHTARLDHRPARSGASLHRDLLAHDHVRRARKGKGRGIQGPDEVVDRERSSALIATSTSLPIAGPEAAGVSCRTTMLNCAGKLPVATTTPSISGRAVLPSSKKISVATSVLFVCKLMFTETISFAAMQAKPVRSAHARRKVQELRAGIGRDVVVAQSRLQRERAARRRADHPHNIFQRLERRALLRDELRRRECTFAIKSLTEACWPARSPRSYPRAALRACSR